MLPPDFIAPRYDVHGFAGLPGAIPDLFSESETPALPPEVFGALSRPYEAVVFMYIDAFGWSFFERHRARDPFLQRMARTGRVTRLTAQFPSATAAHVTSIHTGLCVGRSGVFEWQYYEPALDAIIAPLPFSFAGARERDTLKAAGVRPADLLPAQTLYRRLAMQGVRSYVLQHREYTPSSFSSVVCQGAEIVPYRTFPEALVNLRDLLSRQHGRAYYFLYFDRLDAICHEYGPQSPQVDAEITMFLAAMERVFFAPSRNPPKRTLLLITADHGQVAVDPRTTLYLNRAPRFQGIERFLKRNREGVLLVPAGSPRDMFLYVHDEALDEAHAFLAGRLEGRAVVWRVRDLIEQGYFGPPPPSPAFLSRTGDLVILPYAGESVWWYEPGRFEQKFHGHHGGLTRQEMEIPLLVLDMS